MTENQRLERKELIDTIGEIIFQMSDVTRSLASAGGAFAGMQRTDVRTAMIVLELRKMNAILAELLEEVKK